MVEHARNGDDGGWRTQVEVGSNVEQLRMGRIRGKSEQEEKHTKGTVKRESGAQMDEDSKGQRGSTMRQVESIGVLHERRE